LNIDIKLVYNDNLYPLNPSFYTNESKGQITVRFRWWFDTRF